MYCNLHGHSEYSLLDGVGTPKQIAERAKEIGQPGAVISDHGNLMGVPHHLKACKEVGIKPIIGVEAYFKPDRHLKDSDHQKNWHLLLIAKNNVGFKNLIRLTSEAHATGFYHKPCVDWELLKLHSEGIICSSACIAGYLSWNIQQGDDYHARETIENHLAIFGEDYRLEIMPHGKGLDAKSINEHQNLNNQIAKYALEYGVPVIATNDSHYPDKDWKETQDIVAMIDARTSFEKRPPEPDESGFHFGYGLRGDTFHMLSEQEMRECFHEYHPILTKGFVEEALSEPARIAEKIEEVDLDRSDKMPRLHRDYDKSKKQLRKWCKEGLKRVSKNNDSEYITRMEYELKIIEDKGAVDYLLLVGEIVRWARYDAKIRVSSGRGSAAGSLVSYLIGITSIDPVAHKLLFERFLNPDRKGMPDIDIDFDSERRDEVKEHIAEIVGQDHVSDIAAIGTYKQKSSIKDVGRVLDIPFGVTNEVTKHAEDDIELELQAKRSKEIKAFSKDYPEAWKHILRIEGNVAGLSKHAGGVVVSDKPLTEYIPLMRGANEGLVTSWTDSAHYPVIADINLLKIDVLSIDGLTKQDKAVKMIKRYHDKDINLDTLSIATDPNSADPEILSLYRKGLTMGLFQFNSSGMTSFLKRISPDRFGDLVAANALYRPGATGGGDAFEYATRKHEEKLKNYGWPKAVREYLEETYMILTYQEQMMEIVKQLGGFSPAQADDMRKAASKLYRIPGDEAKRFMQGYFDTFQKGCVERDIDDKTRDIIWDKIISFGSYSFNKAHSASYSFQSYQDAYLKTYYPMEFYASLLDIEVDRRAEVFREARALDIEIMPPDINESDGDFTIQDKRLLYGLVAVKFIGHTATNIIEQNRPYTSLEQFRDNVPAKTVNSRCIDYLVMAGAFDSLGARDDIGVEEKRDQEIEALGVAISGVGESHKYYPIIEQRINTQDEFDIMSDGDAVVIGGEIAAVKKITTKKGDSMAFGQIVFKDNTWETTIFPGQYRKYLSLLIPGNLIMVKGKKSERGSYPASIVVNNMCSLQQLEKDLNATSGS